MPLNRSNTRDEGFAAVQKNRHARKLALGGSCAMRSRTIRTVVQKFLRGSATDTSVQLEVFVADELGAVDC